MSSQKHGYVIIDCNTTLLDLQPVTFLLEYSSVLCVTISGSKEVPINRAYNEMIRILALIGRFDIPVIKGGLSGKNAAARQLVHICQKFSHKVTVVCLGPLSNIAAALQTSKRFEKSVKRVICMSDGFNGKLLKPFWNLKADKEASRQVFTSRLPIVLLPSSLSCSVPITSYLAIREGTNGFFPNLFDRHEEVLFAASRRLSSCYVCLQKVATALIAMKPSLITERQLVNFSKRNYYTESSVSYSTPSINMTNLVSYPSSSFSLSFSHSLSTENLDCLNKTENNVLVVKKVDQNGLLKFYRHIYLLGTKGRLALSFK